MIIEHRDFHVKGVAYKIRPAVRGDAKKLSELRLQIDGETENMDREQGEGFIDEAAFERIIENDATHPRNLFLVADYDGRLIGYSRCQGYDLKRFSHKVVYGLGVLMDFWGYAIGKNLMMESIAWADSIGIKKIVLEGVLETNEKAIEMYKRLGFEIEGTMKKDKLLSDGKYYTSYIMSRFND